MGPDSPDWHWLTYNFTPGSDGASYFAPLTLEALNRADLKMPGYAESMIHRLELMRSAPKDMKAYNSIKQWLAEVLVVDHLVKHPWQGSTHFEMEPTAPGSKKNPEVAISLEGIGCLGVEVKCPNLDAHVRLRAQNLWQLTDRTNITPANLSGEVTLPRDNPLKDFLISADEKFASFKAERSDFQSVLYVVWDDYINEPLSALSSPNSGLLTPNTFYRDSADQPVTFPNVDAVVLMRHQHQFVEGMANRAPIDQRRDFLDYGRRQDFPPHALITNPHGHPLASEWVGALGAWDIGDLVTAGAEYHPSSVVMWLP